MSRRTWTLTLRPVHALAAFVIVAVGLGAFFGGRALSSNSHPAAAPATRHTTSTTTKAPTTTTTSIPPTTTTTTATPTTTTTIPPTTTTTAPSTPVMVTAQGGAVREPQTIYWGGAHNNDTTNIVWSSWGPDSATGTGEANSNNCTPDCADGTVTVISETVTLSQPVNGMFTAINVQGGSEVATYGSSLWPMNATVADGPLVGTG